MDTTSAPAPLTTTFTPSLSCFTSYWYNNVGYNGVGPSSDASECFPSGWTATDTITYSPALLCPAGYTTVLRETIEREDTTTTRATCCPSKYFWTSPTPNGFEDCYSSWAGSPSPMTMMRTSTTASTLYYFSGMDAWIRASAIVIQNTNLPSIAPPPITFPSTSPTPTSTTSNVEEPSAGSTELSTGTKVAIGVGVPVFAMLCAAVVGMYLVLRRRRDTDLAKPVHDPAQGPQANFIPQYDIYAGQGGFVASNTENNNLQELANNTENNKQTSGHDIQELASNAGHNKLPSGHNPQELAS